VSGSSIIVNPAEIDHLPPAVRSVVIAAFSHALQGVFLVAVPFAVLAVVLSLLMKEIPLRTTTFTPSSADQNGNRSSGADPAVVPSTPAEVAAL
jgi:mannose/fructose/N-acetylgalactosamine-specific phosphotransferase system component IIC